MKIVKVIPLSSGLSKEHLTYFTAKDVASGDIVSVPLRSREVMGLVLEVADAEIEKADLKSAQFTARKISKVRGKSFFSESFLRSVSEVKEYLVSSSGAVLESIVPDVFFKNYDELVPETIGEHSNSKIASEKLVHQAPLDDRLTYYRTFIREAFARKSSVLFCLPTRNDIEKFASHLSKGIEQYTYIFHSDIKDKDQIAQFNSLSAESHPVLIIATPRYLCIPKNNLKAIVVERESSSAYKDLRRPYIDFRVFAEVFANENKIKIIFGDTLLRTETVYRHDQGELGEVAPLSFRISQSAREIIVDTRRDLLDEKDKKKWNPLSLDLIDAIKDTFEREGRVALFSLRKGLAPVTVCKDCGTTHICPRCSSPFVLYKGAEAGERIFVCNKCGNDEDSNALCRHCGSWNLVPLGIGTELLEDAVRKEFPNAEIFVLDKEHAKSWKKANEIVKKFEKSEKGIIIGTELLFYHLNEKVRLAALVSFDSLFSIPSYRINEKILYILYSLKDIASTTFLIQTKYKESDILASYLSGNLIDHYREEIKVRKMLRYPPHSTLIKLSVRGSHSAVEKVHKELTEYFRDFGDDVFLTSIKRAGTAYIGTALLKIPRLEWTLRHITRSGHLNQTLLDILRGLPPYIAISIDPDDVV